MRTSAQEAYLTDPQLCLIELEVHGLKGIPHSPFHDIGDVFIRLKLAVCALGQNARATDSNAASANYGPKTAAALYVSFAKLHRMAGPSLDSAFAVSSTPPGMIHMLSSPC